MQRFGVGVAVFAVHDPAPQLVDAVGDLADETELRVARDDGSYAGDPLRVTQGLGRGGPLGEKPGNRPVVEAGFDRSQDLLCFLDLAALTRQNNVDKPVDGDLIMVIEAGILQHVADTFDHPGPAERGYVVLDDLVIAEILQERQLRGHAAREQIQRCRVGAHSAPQAVAARKR